MKGLRYVASATTAFAVGLALVSWLVQGSVGVTLMVAAGVGFLWSDRLRTPAVWFLIALAVALIASSAWGLYHLPHE